MRMAKVFKSGNSQAVRLPKEFQLNVSEVEISRKGDAIILRPAKRTFADVIALLQTLPDDFPDSIRDLPAQRRKGL